MTLMDLKFWTSASTTSSRKGSGDKEMELVRNISSRHIPGAENSREDPFGDENNAAVKYKTMFWWQAGMIMIAETISLGILALPKVLSTLGLLPGVVAIVGIGIITTYTGFIIGQYKCRYSHIHSMADAGSMLLGTVGGQVIGFVQVLFLVFIMASHILTFSIMLNVLTEHSACTILFSGLGMLISFILTLPRRLEELSHLSWISFVSIIGAVWMCMFGVSVGGSGPQRIPLFPSHPPAYEVSIAISNVVFAYAGHVAFFTLFSELRDIKDYPKALALLQGTEIVLYTVSATVIYIFAGPSVASPALNSTGPVFRKISYAFAVPTIVIGGVVNAHVAVKFIYIRIFHGNNEMHTRSFRAKSVWALICIALWLFSWAIRELIPVFNDILGLASSLFATWFTFSLPGAFGLHLNRQCKVQGRKRVVLSAINYSMVAMGFVICALGIYSSIESLKYSLSSGAGTRSFSCASNA